MTADKMTEEINEKMTGNEESFMEGDEAMQKDESMMKNETRYIVYKNGILDETKDSKRILYFYANWCPICRPIDTELRENSDKIPQDIRIIRVNYNDPETDNDEKELGGQIQCYISTYICTN